jgi:hypothetical protein
VELDCCYLRMLLTEIGPFLSRQQDFDHRNHRRMFLCPSLLFYWQTWLRGKSLKNHLRHQLRAPLTPYVAVVRRKHGKWYFWWL